MEMLTVVAAAAATTATATAAAAAAPGVSDRAIKETIEFLFKPHQ